MSAKVQRAKAKQRYDQHCSSLGSHPASSIDSPTHLLKNLENKRLQGYFEKKRIKEEIKAKEPPEEKRIRRLKEKEAKEIRRRQRMGWDTEYQHYSNQDNPFGDPNLMSSFVWTKKLEKEGYKCFDPKAVEFLSRQKQIDNKIELQKVKERRKEREHQRQIKEEEMLQIQRCREAVQFEEWERQEENFHLEQARLRSIIRIQDGRAKPIDLLAQYVHSNPDDSIEMQMHAPYYFVSGLGIEDLEDLAVDIRVYIEMGKGNSNAFWEDMILIVEDELKKLRKLNLYGDIEPKVGRREGIHQCIVKDVCDIFKGKTTEQLNELRSKIEKKILHKVDGIDISYWESLLSQLNAHMARTRLFDRHQENLKQKLLYLKSNQNEKKVAKSISTTLSDGSFNSNESTDDKKLDDETHPTVEPLDKYYQYYEHGNYTPKYFSLNEIEENAVILSEEEDITDIHRLREIFHVKSLSRQEFEMYCKVRKEMPNNDSEFCTEALLNEQVHLSTDKYRPRKPRYFNRVHTGFEWNKYNQTHYDMDNPPPKIVQGYKFNIFYPDLMDKSTTPQYFLTPSEDNSDFSVLRFHAGPPYEDIAFKVVNREWEFSYKRGFRCQFHNNIFQLWFHFKRYRYRR